MTSSIPQGEIHKNPFQPSDFEDFIGAVLEVNGQDNRFFQRVISLRSRGDVSESTQKQSAQQAMVVLEELMEKRRDLNAHYGWVLASDAGLVYKSMGGKSENGASWAKQWMRGVFDEYERLGQAFVDAKLELELVVTRAAGACEA